jgi:nuclear cap-binding protein subunit 1
LPFCREADLGLPATHPKKVLITRVLELEIRLSYFDRIKLTLPDAYLSPEAGVYPSEAPSPDFTYEQDGSSALQAQGSELVQLMRSRGTLEDIHELLEKWKADMVAGEIGIEPIDEEAAERTCKDLIFQCLLVVGSRSFSHFLNILERYITLLRDSTKSSTARLALLRSVARFWSRNSQFSGIVVDKLLQYRIVDPVDVVAHIFEGEQPVLDGEITARDWTDINAWHTLRMTLEKVQIRVAGATSRLETLRKREENRLDAERAARATEGEMVTDGADDNASGIPVEAAADGSAGEGDAKADAAAAAAAEVAAVERQLASVKKEQEALIVEVVKRFHQTLSSLDAATDVDQWQKWFLQGWFAEFCRAVSPACPFTRQRKEAD